MTIESEIWVPRLPADAGPKYRAIADALGEDIAQGQLAPGARLPTHRDLAFRLGVTVGTVSRAYREAERRGLIGGEIGRGTFVRDLSGAAMGVQGSLPEWELPEPPRETSPETGAISLAFNFPPPALEREALRETLAALAREADLSILTDYGPYGGSTRHREAGAAWIAARGLNAHPDRVVISPGAHNSVLACLSAVTRPGDALLAEELTYPGIKPIARLMGLKLLPVALDDDGLVPDALAEALAAHPEARALYCTPTLQNPTNRVMSAKRRAAVAEIAARAGLAVIEDDILGPLIDDAPPPITALLPEHGYYISSVSKGLAPGLRIGFAAVPAAAVGAVGTAVRASNGMASPMTAEIVARWIEDGTGDRILASRRAEVAARQAMLRRTLPTVEVVMPGGALHAWARLGEEMRPGEWVKAAEKAGVILTPGDAFCVGRVPTPHHVRLCLGQPTRRDTLARALERLKPILEARGRVPGGEFL